ncbi:MAG: VOC family protein [Thalassotalea sp.]
MKYLHAMIRVVDIEASLAFYQNSLGLELIRKIDVEQGRFSLYYLATEAGEPEVELTHNWDGGEYQSGNAFGHLAFEVDDIYVSCQQLEDNGVIILRPPRDGYMAFIKDPNGISIELLQKGDKLAPHDKWSKMENTGSW